MTTPDKTLHPEQWVDEHGDVLYRYALARVRNPDDAEELVQEAMAAALQSRDSYSGQSSERTWLTGILKHKIVDHFRRSARERPAGDLDDGKDGAGGDPGGDFFDGVGRWRISPKNWADPSAALREKEFWKTLRDCLDKLPPAQARIFTLRTIEQLSTEEVCNISDVTATNMGVLLYRARLGLRRCLEINWFANPKPQAEED